MSKPHRLPTIDEQSVLKELQVRLILPGERIRWNKLVSEHHYLKNALLVGEQLRYVVVDAKGTWLALMGWSAAAMHLKARDQSIEPKNGGWNQYGWHPNCPFDRSRRCFGLQTSARSPA